MAIRDIEAFIRERAAQWDPNLDLTSGSPFDVQVIQPLVRRLGIDPFTVDLPTFIDARLRQAFPDLAVGEGDAITDLLVKPATVLWDPIVREVTRVQRNLSFRDPSMLSIEEAESLGANLFSERATGDYARGQARIFFGQPQNISISPVNFCTAKKGLRFLPTEVQTIRTEEMVLNLAEDGTYYFDINTIAENPGDEYNIGPNELISIANVESAVRVRNLRRFQRGEAADTAEEFVAKAQGDLTERSLVALRGIASKVTTAFPEVRRLNVVGFNDPEMQRDIVTGGGLGTILASGMLGETADDGDNQSASRRFRTTEVDFTVLIGSASLVPDGYVLTVVEGVDSLSAPIVQDFNIIRVIDANTLEIEDQVLGLGRTNRRWSLRRSELTLSGLPGGIIFPDGPQGTVSIRHDQIHIGDAFDLHIRSSSFDEATLVLDNVTDDVVELEGIAAKPKTLSILGVAGFELGDLTTSIDYDINSETFRLLERAGQYGLTLQIVSGPDSTNVGVYRILKSAQQTGSAVELQVSPTPPVLDSLDYRWRLFDEVNIDLVDPKETRTSGDDLITIQNSDEVTTTAGINFNDLGVSQGDVLRILDGPDAGDYTIAEPPLAPGYDSLRLDTALLNTSSGLSYTIFRPNTAGGIVLPLIRIKEIELLDSSNQPLGSMVPYARPIDIQSRAFQNPARGVKHTLSDVELGIITGTAVGSPLAFPGLTGTTIKVKVLNKDGTEGNSGSVAFTTDFLTDAITTLNSAASLAGATGTPFFQFPNSSGTRIAARPTGVGLILEGGNSLPVLFGGLFEPRTTADIRSAAVVGGGGWDALSPAMDFATGLDVVQVVAGNQVGIYSAPYSGPLSTGRAYDGDGLLGIGNSTALIIRDIDLPHDENSRQFAPEENVRMELGARSLGSARCYFLEPTSIEFNGDSFFSVETEAGEVRFVPDPTLDHQIIPPLPSDDKSNDGEVDTTTPTIFESPSQNFLRSGVNVGDELVLDYIPLAGSIVLPDPVPNLAALPSIPQGGRTLVFSIDNGPNLSLTFIKDDISLNEGEVTRQGVVDQINSKAGSEIAHLTSDNRLEFEADALIAIKSIGTANMPDAGPPVFGGLLGDVYGTGGSRDFSANRNNESPNVGRYRITAVNETQLIVTPPFGSISPYTGTTLDRQGFRVYRVGSQRISTTQMAAQQAEADLYYFDVELVSEGTGDIYNIDAALQLLVESFRADGYYLTTDDSNLTFSIAELPKLVLSKSILEEGVDDDPNNATQIAGQNLQITYDRSQLVVDVQNFVNSETERVVCANPLSRYLVPHFVRFDLVYIGGSREDVVLPEINKYILNLLPADALESSDVQKIVMDKGATSIENPLDLIAVVHNVDRTIQATRSQNSLTTGRLHAFIPDIINLTRNIT